MTIPDPDTLTFGAIFVAGLATSLHCAGMCGLLTCGLGIAGRGPALASVGVYHFFRLVGYATAGGFAGFLGSLFGLETKLAGVGWLPFALLFLLAAIVLGLDRRIGSIPALSRTSVRIRLSAFRFSPTIRAAAVGIATPLLPCGPLYAMLAISLATGSTIRGMETMLVFGLGALPAIWATQVGSTWFQNRVSTGTYLVARRSLALIAALSLLWHYSLFGLGSNRIEPTECRCELESE